MGRESGPFGCMKLIMCFVLEGEGTRQRWIINVFEFLLTKLLSQDVSPAYH